MQAMSIEGSCSTQASSLTGEKVMQRKIGSARDVLVSNERRVSHKEVRHLEA